MAPTAIQFQPSQQPIFASTGAPGIRMPAPSVSCFQQPQQLVSIGAVECCGVLWGAERSMTMRCFPEYFLVAIPRGLMWKLENRERADGRVMKPSCTFLARGRSTDSGSVMAD